MMLREGLAYFTGTSLTMIAFALFFVTFVGIVLWTYRRSARGHYDEMARLPLDERNSK
jgi:cbb3-type cytochrome oxidase subunit 3